MLKNKQLTFFLLFSAVFLSVGTRASAAPYFSKESGVRIASGTPQAIVFSTAGAYRMYVVRDFQVHTATSSDGLVWGEESGIRLSSNTNPSLGVSSITAFSVLPLASGGFRSIYTAQDSSGSYRVCSATSSDGMSWANELSTPIVAGSTGVFMGSPRLLTVPGGDWRLYLARNTDGGSNPMNRQVYTSLSTDEGVTWSSPTVVLASQVGEICVSTLTNAKVRIFYSAPLTSDTTYSQVLSGLSSNSSGDSFSAESGVRLATAAASGSISFPLVVRSTEAFRWRMYYAFTAAGSSTPQIFSALTTTCDVQSLTPNAVNRTDPVAAFTIKGEVFSPNATVKLIRTGQSDIVGTSVSRTDDQTITATFNTMNQDLGAWALVVTNEDGLGSTLTNALIVTFAGGEVVLTDNLLRPLSNARTRIDMNIFEIGRLHVAVYTLQGRLIRTVFDQDGTIGTNTAYWDGRTDDGAIVASGVYVLKISGPKLDQMEKVVVIK